MNSDHDTHNEACGCCPPATTATVMMPKNEVVATAAPPQPKMSRAEYGKLRRQYITQVFDTVTECGHKFNPLAVPKHANCESCWIAFFNTHPGITTAAQSIIAAFGMDQLIKCQGKKFAQQYMRYQENENAKHKDAAVCPAAITG
jgi:hypothetical protein